jgi:hypothetical protein
MSTERRSGSDEVIDVDETVAATEVRGDLDVQGRATDGAPEFGHGDVDDPRRDRTADRRRRRTRR